MLGTKRLAHQPTNEMGGVGGVKTVKGGLERRGGEVKRGSSVNRSKRSGRGSRATRGTRRD